CVGGGVSSWRPARRVRPFEVGKDGDAGRTSNGRTGSDPEGSSPKDCSQVPRLLRFGADAGLAGVGSSRPAVDVRPFEVVMAGEAGRTSNGRTGSDPEGSSPKDCSQVPRLSSAIGVGTGAGVGTRIRTAAATAPAKRTPAPTSRTVFSPLTKAITAECSRP